MHTDKQYVDMLHSHCKKVLEAKGKEYAPEGDNRFIAFEKGAMIFNDIGSILSELDSNDMVIALLSKHLVSIEDIAANKLPLSKELLYEKCGDALNYMALYGGMLEEELGWNIERFERYIDLACEALPALVDWYYTTINVFVNGMRQLDEAEQPQQGGMLHSCSE